MTDQQSVYSFGIRPELAERVLVTIQIKAREWKITDVRMNPPTNLYPYHRIYFTGDKSNAFELGIGVGSIVSIAAENIRHPEDDPDNQFSSNNPSDVTNKG